MNLRKRLFCLLLVMTMILGMFSSFAFAAETDVITAQSSQFSDMPDNWSTAALGNAVANGLLTGADGKIMPDSPLTRAQMAAVIVRAFKAMVKGDISGFSDVGSVAWISESLAKAYQMGVIKGSNGKMNPNASITREEVFVILARAFKMKASETISKSFSDVSAISSWAKGDVYAFVNAGYVNGSGGILNPKGLITRAEFAQIFDNILKKYISEAGIVTSVPEGNIMVNVPGVTLQNLTVKGDLVIGDGVGDGEVILENVTITGRMVIRGGGVNSVIIRGNSSVASVIVSRVDGEVSVKVQGNANVEVIYVDDGSDDVIVEGTVGNIDVAAPGITLTTSGATIGTVNVSGANTNIVVSSGSSVGTVTTSGENTQIKGSGTVTKVEAQSGANNTKVETPNTQILVGTGVTGVTGGGGTEIIGGSTVNNNSTGSGTQTPTSSGGGSSGDDDTPTVSVTNIQVSDATTVSFNSNAVPSAVIWNGTAYTASLISGTQYRITVPVITLNTNCTLRVEASGYNPFTKSDVRYILIAWDGSETTEVMPDGDIYEIMTGAELAWIAAQANAGTTDFSGKTVKLMNDINLGSQEWTPIGTSAHPFTGVFDGDGNAVYGLKISSGTSWYNGFFGKTSGGEIKDTIFADADVQDADGTVDANMAIVAGYTENTDVTDVSIVRGTVMGSRVGSIVGAFTGDAAMTSSSSSATVNATPSAAHKQAIVGGLIQQMEISSGDTTVTTADNSDITALENCSFTGTINVDAVNFNQSDSGNWLWVGQLFGGTAHGSYYNLGIKDCSASGTVNITNLTATTPYIDNTKLCFSAYVNGGSSLSAANHTANGNGTTPLALIPYGRILETYGVYTDIGGVVTYYNGVHNETSGVLYDTIQDAVDGAVATGDSLIMGTDENLGSNEILVDGKTLTLDLNGYAITSSSANWVIKVATGAVLTINDSSTNGTGKVTNTTESGEALRCYGTLTINGGTYTATAGEGGYALIMANRTTGTEYDCNVTINGGTFNGWFYDNGTDAYCKLTINDGIFSKSFYLASAYTDATINDGTFVSGGGESVIEIKAGTLNITGGTFTNNIDTSDNTAATASNNGSGQFKGVIVGVKPSGSATGAYGSPVIINISGGTFANSLGEAIVLADQTGSGKTGGGSVTANISGDTDITGDIAIYDSSSNAANASTLNISGGTVDGDITIEENATGNSAINISGGTFCTAGALLAAVTYAETNAIISVAGQIGSDTDFTVYNVKTSITIQGTGASKSVIYGTFHVYTNGVGFDNLIIRNKGGYPGLQQEKAAIDVLARQISITGCDFIMGINVPEHYVANGVTIWPMGTDAFNLTMSGNTFTGYDANTDAWSSCAFQIVENININTSRYTEAVSVYGSSPRAGTITVTDESLLAIAAANEYSQCANDFIYQDWDGYTTNQQYKFIYATSAQNLSEALGYTGDGARIVLGDDIALTADETLKVGTTLVIPDGITLEVASGATFTIESGATVSGIITGEGDWTGKE